MNIYLLDFIVRLLIAAHQFALGHSQLGQPMVGSKSKDAESSEPAPAKPKGWMSATDLEREYVGDHGDLHDVMAILRQALIRDLMHALHCSEEEAVSLVETHLIGCKKPQRGYEALAASPDAVRLLDLVARTDAAPPKADGWQSANELCVVYQGNPRAITRRLERLRDELLADFEAFGLGQAGPALIENHLIGYRKPSAGPEALAASSDAVRLAEDAGVLIRRTLSTSPPALDARMR